MKQTQVKSITNTTFGKPDVKNLNKPLMNVVGIARDFFTNNTKYGESVGFKGDFVAVDAKTGDVVTANAIFLPQSLEGTVHGKLKDGQTEVEFKYTLSATESDKNAQGYAFIAEEPVTEDRVNDQNRLLEMATGLPLLGKN